MSIHFRNLQTLTSEMFKAYKIVPPPVLTDTFSERNLNYKVRHTLHFFVSCVRIVYNGTESLSFLDSKV